MSRISKAFQQAKADNRAAFIPYLTCGFPDETRFIPAAQTLLRYADVLEIGLPYSDPLGDGVTIQQSSEKVLAQGMNTQKVLEAVAHLRPTTDKALVLMSYYNPLYCYPQGEAQFIKDATEAGVDGIILPDLPPDAGQEFIAVAREHGLETIFLLAPTSTDARIQYVSSQCRGFIYAVSVTGVTGTRDTPLADVPDLVKRIKAQSDLPVAVGFGVKNAATARPVADVADGVVVGSALIKALAEAEDESDLQALAEEIRQACHK